MSGGSLAEAIRGRSEPPRERLVRALILGAALLSVLTTAGIVAVLAGETVGFFREVGFAAFFLDTEWTPLFARARFGIWPLVAGTALTSAIALAVAVPVGVLAAIYLAEFAAPATRRFVKPALELLAGVPTVVYGYFALIFVTPLLQHLVPGLASFNALGAGIVMGLMIMPMVSSLGDDAIRAVPDALREGAMALGADRLTTVLRVVLPAARSGILAASILAVSRAIGETMIVTIAAGQQPRLTADPRVPVETMTAYIVQVSLGDTPAGSLAWRTIFAVAAMLFVSTLAMNLLGQRLARGARRQG